MARGPNPRALRWSALFVWALALASTAWADGETVRVARVLDGDSLLLSDGRQVRLIGINTPEFGRDGAAHQPGAVEARARTAALAEGREIVLVFDAERKDRHGRSLAYVVLEGGRELQEYLLAEGLAWYVAIPPNLARLSRYRELERAAREARRGVWSDPSYRAVPAVRLAPGDTGFRRIEGRVERVRYTKRFVRLELGGRTSIVVPREDWRYFPRAPETYVGRRLVARGWVGEYKGLLRLRISHPAMIEVLH
ncbi:nuclease [Sulfurifustis variabilis]|uniref:Nuclease n=1 Tax=Sulfurifustis variabilis TaxID=1675686 RepID=A0A1C7AG09_9GAMM|nr:thermonuclease family protein [Sulfurifustis variabilis]BAU50383.1 nuclease [Sulfurifustis variabilis]